MLTKLNILDEFSKLVLRERELTMELRKDYPETVKQILRRELTNINDNLYRLKLQAKAWGLLK